MNTKQILALTIGVLSSLILSAGTVDKNFKAVGPAGVACSGVSFTLTTNDKGAAEYSWYPEHMFTNSHQKTVTTSITRTTQFMVVRTKNGNQIDTAYVTVVVEEEEVDLLGNEKFCEGKRSYLELPGSYKNTLWSTGETTDGIWVSQAGTYHVEAIKGCKTIIGEIEVSVIPKPLARIVTFDDLDICKGEEVTMSVFGQTNDYSWSTGAPERVIRVNSSTTINLKVENQCGVSNDSKTVTVHDVDASFIPSKTNGLVPFELKLINESNTAATDNWYVNGKLFSKNREGSLRIAQAGDYEIELVRTNIYGCTEKMKYSSIVALPAPPKTVDEDNLVVYPNSFTPNGDGLNDEFRFHSNYIQTINFSIFDRWGREIFQSDNSTGWDGSLPNGAAAAEGQYIIMYEFEDLDGAIINRTVPLNLLR